MPESQNLLNKDNEGYIGAKQCWSTGDITSRERNAADKLGSENPEEQKS